MLRQSRINPPGALHHVIVRGIERRNIFRDDQDHSCDAGQLPAFGCAERLLGSELELPGRHGVRDRSVSLVGNLVKARAIPAVARAVPTGFTMCFRAPSE